MNLPYIGQSIPYFPQYWVDSAKGVSAEKFLILLADIFQRKMPGLGIRGAKFPQRLTSLQAHGADVTLNTCRELVIVGEAVFLPNHRTTQPRQHWHPQ